MNTGIKSVVVCIVTLAIVLILTLMLWGLHLWWLDGIVGAVSEAVLGQTEYSVEYHERNFRKITAGMNTGDVLKVLGPPIEKRPIREGGEEIWFYTKGKIRDRSGRGTDCCYTERNIFFTNGLVSEIRHGFYFD